MRAAPMRARAYASSRIETPADEPRNRSARHLRRLRMTLSLGAKRRVLAALSVVSIILWPALARSVEAKTLRFAFQGELKSVDPYQINESFSLSVNGAVYEGLVRFRPDLTLEPSLATSW